MNHHPDVFPAIEADLILWLDNFVSRVDAKSVNWNLPVDHPSTGELRESSTLFLTVDALKGAYTDYKAKYAIVNDPTTHTPVAVANKNAAKKSLIEGLRRFIKEHIVYNSLITDADLISLGLKPHKTTHTPAAVATTYPVAIKIESSAPGVLLIHVEDSEKNKPNKTKGFVCRYAILDEHPTYWDKLPQKAYSQSSTLTLTFDINQCGKTVYLSMCWENTRGEHGNWGPIVSAIIG
ncbi:MAG: hypothetical protein LBD21_04365 [Tannerellaceae bacterium]|jgi:hypothetical protein|nr:hypothetical protein [Tannerellaceae bacterium]